MNTQTINDVSNLCEDPETKGFDLQAGQSWIYPTNYPVRDYQYNIIQEALHKNTLVSLPTGLGKTFIAAVVMYNFYRWYPHGKIIFMAPTRPLVEQQIDACYNIMAIPQEVTAELTGVKKAQASRGEIWQTKRVFFITPQVLQNDLESVLELGNKIKCLVFDEAHKAKSNYAYCEVIRRLLPKNKLFRVLALSATPGNSVKDVIEVMENLLIAHLEFRSEESPDVKCYVFERSLETVVVPLGEKLQKIKQDYEQNVLEKYVRTLIRYNIVHGNFSNLTKGKIFMIMKDFQNKNRGKGTPNYSEIVKTLSICLSLYHAYEALIRCGLRVFLSYFEDHIHDPLLAGNTTIMQIMNDLSDYLGPSPNVNYLPDGTVNPIPVSTKFGHPKFYQLRDILLAHFTNCDNSSRVIVFFEYKESVKEAYAMLSQNHPTIRPRIFVGQSSGIRQKDQIHTVKMFREGSCNTLLSTSIGEEGLDVGEINLIVCFDITNKSPIRMIQRMGRTGRKKEGRIIVLVTEGKEQQTLKDCLIYKNNLGLTMTNSPQLDASKYKDNPKMIPSYLKPKCQKMFITVKKTATSKNNNLKDMFRNIASEKMKFLEDVEIVEIKERINSKVENYWNKADPLSYEFKETQINFSKHLEKQRSFQACGEVKQSKQTHILVNLLQYADSKRFNLPVTQTFGRLDRFTDKHLKQGDIRNMFSKEAAIPISQIYYFEKEKDITQTFPEELFQEITSLLLIQEVEDNCKICANLFECPKFFPPKSTNSLDLSSFIVPDLSTFDSLTADNLNIFIESLSPKSNELYDSMEGDDDVFENIQFTQFAERKHDINKTEDSAYETPRNFEKILDSFKIYNKNSQEEQEKHHEKSFAYEIPKSFAKILNSFQICKEDDFDPPEIKTISKKICEDPKKISNSDYSEILAFFKLSSLEDLYAQNLQEFVDPDVTLVYTPEVKCTQSPDLFEPSPDLFPESEEKQTSVISEEPDSPILCSYDKVQKLKAKKKLFDSTDNESFSSNLPKKPNLSNLNLPRRSFFETNLKTPEKQEVSPKNHCSNIPEFDPLNVDISDVCDLSNFGITTKTIVQNDKKEDREIKISDLDISDICDLSMFGLSKVDKKNVNEAKVYKEKNYEKKKESSKQNFDENEINDISDFLNQSSKKSLDCPKKIELEINSNKISDISDFCDISASFTDNDLSIFGFSRVDKMNVNKAKVYKEKNYEKNQESSKQNITENEINDISDFLNESSKKSLDCSKKIELEVKSNNISDISDFCDISASFIDNDIKKDCEKSDNQKTKNKCNENCKKKNEDEDITLIELTDTPESNKKSQADSISKIINDDLDNFCDLSNFFDITTKHEKKIEENKDIITIDLTDSPEKTQSANKPLTQLSITQMISLMAKGDNNGQNTSQKENSASSTAQKSKKVGKKSLLSLNNKKKGLLQLKQNQCTPKSKSNRSLQKKNITPKVTSKFNLSLAGNSDDEFEDLTTSPIFAKPKPVTSSSSSVKKNKTKSLLSLKQKKPKKLFCEFLDEEAVLSEDDNVLVSDDEDSGEDTFETSFVNDETQDLLNRTEMHAQYLKTTKSLAVQGKFKIPDRPHFNVTNVFSQEVDYEDDTYLNDSFVVDTEEIDSPKKHELSELEILELKLKKMKKSKKRKSDEKQSAIITKRRRILAINDDSD